jgi:hypothetical protein
LGYQVPPGISDATVPNPIFNLTPAATVDEGNNWINITWGPLALTNPITNATLGNYSITSGSSAIGGGTSESGTYPTTTSDYFGIARPQGARWDIGAVEFVGSGAAALSVSPTSLAFGDQTVNTTSASQTLTLSNSGGATATAITLTFSGPYARATAGGSCGTTLAGNASCTINVVFRPTVPGSAAGSLTIGASVPVAGSPVAFTGTGTRLSASPATLTFFTILGNTFGPAQNITVRNNGTTGSTGPISTSVTGATNGVVFQVTSNNCPVAGLAPGASCTLGVQFRSPTPLTMGTATLTISDTEPAAVTVGLTGTRLF